MEIKRIEFRNIYGALSGKLKFSTGENFLVGINGCGKTTVLNLIRWVLSPDLSELCTMEHELIKVDVLHEGYMYSIQSRIKNNIHELKVVTRNKKRDFKPIRSPLLISPNMFRARSSRVDRDEIKDQYSRLTPEAHEVSTFNFLLDELPSPVFIGLERKIDDSPSRLKRRQSQRKNISETLSPLGMATTLMRDAFNTGRRKVVEINDTLNRNVLELSFSGVIRDKLDFSSNAALKDTAQKITQLRKRFDDQKDNKDYYSKTLSDIKVREAIIKYLDQLSSLFDEDTDEVWLALNEHNFDRAKKMFDLFESYENDVRKVQAEITNFSESVNEYLNDSRKTIYFDADTGVPYIELSGYDERLELSELSSGESQIIILLSYFAFLAKKGIPIVIDEPELSLHVQWQKHFVNSVKNVMPHKCQTIMATHSPEICGAEDVNVQAISVKAS